MKNKLHSVSTRFINFPEKWKKIVKMTVVKVCIFVTSHYVSNSLNIFKPIKTRRTYTHLLKT